MSEGLASGEPPIYTGRRLYNMAQVCEITTLSRSTIYRLVKRGLFPPPETFEHVQGRIFWDAQAVDEWVNGQCGR